MRVETDRLLLVPIGPQHAVDLYRLRQDPWVAHWYGGTWNHDEATAFASSCAEAWTRDGVSKWMAYERSSGSLVGRGGMSRLGVNASSTAQIDALLDDPKWRADRLEVGWAVMGNFRKRGMATEIGTAALSFATDQLGASRVIAYTERHNLASRRVMERLGMLLAGEIRARGLVDGQDEEQDDAPFAVYATRELWQNETPKDQRQPGGRRCTSTPYLPLSDADVYMTGSTRALLSTLMTTSEYRCESLWPTKTEDGRESVDETAVTNALNGLAADGWDLVQVVALPSGGNRFGGGGAWYAQMLYYFRRDTAAPAQ
jgi:RimJ/RimL family protein N-acetyltransferase